MVVGVLVDVGGTLWPDRFAPVPAAIDPTLDRLGALMPQVPVHRVHELVDRLRQLGGELDGALEQDSLRLTQRAAEELGLAIDAVLALEIRRAMAGNTSGRERLFSGVPQLLQTIREVRGRCVILSNAAWRGAREYRADFEVLGLAEYVDAYVSSVDIGYRKPHVAIFEAALAAAGCAAEACVMIGNSEVNDVVPAVALGMRALRVAIEEPPPIDSAADAVVTSLPEAAAVLREWVERGGWRRA